MTTSATTSCTVTWVTERGTGHDKAPAAIGHQRQKAREATFTADAIRRRHGRAATTARRVRRRRHQRRKITTPKAAAATNTHAQQRHAHEKRHAHGKSGSKHDPHRQEYARRAQRYWRTQPRPRPQPRSQTVTRASRVMTPPSTPSSTGTAACAASPRQRCARRRARRVLSSGHGAIATQTTGTPTSTTRPGKTHTGAHRKRALKRRRHGH